MISGCPVEKIAGIGFDATCSLVAVDKDDKPLTVSTTGDNNQNIILWMDHRASEEAARINDTKHELLKCVGGKVSLEMEIPKVMWLKSHLNKECWSKLGKLFDLPDYLTWRCTGDDTRSLCSIVCKWNFDGFNHSWSRDFFEKIDLKDLCEDDFAILGKNVTTPGATIGNGLNEQAARELGLKVGTPVAGSMIDAHAGALSLFGCHAEGIEDDVSSKMALICGTSSCHMSVEKNLVWANGKFIEKEPSSLFSQNRAPFPDYFKIIIIIILIKTKYFQASGVHTKMQFSQHFTCTKVVKVQPAFYWIIL